MQALWCQRQGATRAPLSRPGAAERLLRPWLVRIEQAMNLALLSPTGRQTHFIEHNAEGLLRGDQTQRYEAYRIGREWGWLSVNEIRRRENLGSVGPNGDCYLSDLKAPSSSVG